MKRICWIGVLTTFTAISVYGQDPLEALRFSLLKPGGTARGMALGGAMGSIGADPTSLVVNPAGIGFYRRSEAMFTGHLVVTQTGTNLDGNIRNDNRTNFNFGNAGIVFTRLFEDRRGDPTHGKWRSVNFGLVYNRLANFQSQRLYENNSTPNSILADYKNELNNSSPASTDINQSNFSFGTVAAYNAGLLNPDPTNNAQYSAVTDGHAVDQQINVRTKGAVDELAFTVGANYNNVLYFGGSLGVPFVNYQEDVTITETNNSGIPHFNSLQEERILSSSGVGVNAKFGMIYKPNNYFRIGASVHSPNWYSITDHYSTQSTGSFDTATYSNTLNGVFDYKLRSPFRTIGSASVFFKKYGFFSLDYEYADYGSARYTYAQAFSAEQTSVNDLIKTTLQKTHTIRAGVELAYNIFRLRGGYSYTTSPIASAARIGNADYVGMTYSGGIGFRWRPVYLDITYLRNKVTTASTFASDVIATNHINQDNIIMTFGFNF